MKEEKVLIIIKPDALVRGFFGEIVTRFERKGLKIIATKMTKLEDIMLEKHYSHIADKPFFGGTYIAPESKEVSLPSFSSSWVANSISSCITRRLISKVSSESRS